MYIFDFFLLKHWVCKFDVSLKIFNKILNNDDLCTIRKFARNNFEFKDQDFLISVKIANQNKKIIIWQI